MNVTKEKLISDKHMRTLTNLIDGHLKEPFELVVLNVTDGTDEYPMELKMAEGKYEVRIRRVKEGKTGKWITIAGFELRQMINCCGICVSTRANVMASYQGFGLGTALNSMRIDIARQAGYSLLLCTDVLTNEPQTKILRTNGWKEVYRFVNQNTQNMIGIHVIPLR